MIFDTLDHIDTYKNIHPGLYKALTILRDTDFDALTTDRVEVDGKNLFFFVQIGQLLVHLGQAGQILVVEVHIGAGLVQQVDGLVRQISVGNVPLAHGDGQTAHLLGDRHLVEAGVVGSNSLQNTDAVSDGGFLHQHRLEAALQRGVLLDVLAVLR